MADMLQFKKGLRAGLPTTYSAGTIYVTTDERAMYVDISDTQRIRLGDFIECATMAEFQSLGHYSQTALYYVAEGHKLLKYSNTDSEGKISFVHLNSVQGVSEEITGLGDRIGVLETFAQEVPGVYATKTELANEKSALVGAIALKADATALEAEATAARAAEEALGLRIDGVVTNVGNNATAIEDIKNNYATSAKLAEDKKALEDAIALKADAADLEAEAGRAAEAEAALGLRIDGVATNVGNNATAIEEVKRDYATKQNLADEKANLTTAINDKADKSALAELSETVSANKTAADQAIGTINTTLGEHGAAITTLQTNSVTKSELAAHAETFEGKINAKADLSELNTLKTTVSDLDAAYKAADLVLTGKIGENATAIEDIKKTYATDVELSNAVDEINQNLDKKASTEDLNAEIKRAGDAEVALGKRIDGVETNVGNNATAIEEIKRDYATKQNLADEKAGLEGAIALKADATALEAEAAAARAAEKALGERIDGVNTTVGEHATAIEENQEAIEEVSGNLSSFQSTVAATYVTLEAYNAKMKAVDAKDKSHDDDIATLKGNVGTLQTTVGNHDLAIEENARNISTNTNDIADLKQADIDLKSYIDGQFDAANAMRFMGSTTSLASLKDGSALNDASKPAQAGDTYVLTATDTTSTEGVIYAIGDLFIAQVDNDNTKWTHVASGYVQDHESNLSGANNKISLRSYTGANLGDINVVAAANSAITANVSGNTMTIGMEWGSF